MWKVSCAMSIMILKLQKTYRSNIDGTTQSMSIQDCLFDVGTCNQGVELMRVEQQERLKVHKQRNRRQL